jgi:hypothetical protein
MQACSAGGRLGRRERFPGAGSRGSPPSYLCGDSSLEHSQDLNGKELTPSEKAEFAFMALRGTTYLEPGEVIPQRVPGLLELHQAHVTRDDAIINGGKKILWYVGLPMLALVVAHTLGVPTEDVFKAIVPSLFGAAAVSATSVH